MGDSDSDENNKGKDDVVQLPNFLLKLGSTYSSLTEGVAKAKGGNDHAIEK